MNDTIHTVTFSDHWYNWITDQGLGLEDRTRAVDPGFTRIAFAGTQDQLDALHAALTSHREGLTGTDKARATRALQRIHTSADLAAWEARRIAVWAAYDAKHAAKSNA